MDEISIIDTSAHVATVLAAIVAIWALVVASRAHRASSAAAREAHMHGLFRSYLNENRPADAAPSSESPVSVRLYVLEEMFAWTEVELKLNRDWLGRRDETRQKLILAWQETILVHAGYDFVDVVENISDYRQCYGLTFLKFLDKELTPERALAAISGRHFRVGNALERSPEGMEWHLARLEIADRDLREIVALEEDRRTERRIYLPDNVVWVLPVFERIRKRDEVALRAIADKTDPDKSRSA